MGTALHRWPGDHLSVPATQMTSGIRCWGNESCEALPLEGVHASPGPEHGVVGGAMTRSASS